MKLLRVAIILKLVFHHGVTVGAEQNKTTRALRHNGDRFLASNLFYLCFPQEGKEGLDPIWCRTNKTTCNTAPETGQPVCKCMDGFTGKLCQDNIDECAGSYPCVGGDKSTSFCVNQDPPAKYECGCRVGYHAVLPDQKDVEDPVPAEWRPIKCVPKDNCLGSPCHVDAICTNVPPDDFNCTCKSPLIGNGITSCILPPSASPTPKPTPTLRPTPECTVDDDCAGNELFTCVDGVCVCAKGYFRTPGKGSCQNENECAEGYSNDCDKRNAICVDTEGSYVCFCRDGFQDVNSTLPSGIKCKQTNECLDATLNDCNATTQVCIDAPPPTKWICLNVTVD